MKKTIIKLSYTDNCVIFNATEIEGTVKTKISGLYCTKEEIETLINTGYVVVKDCYNFAVLRKTNNNQVSIEYAKLDIASPSNKIQGQLYSWYIDYDKFMKSVFNEQTTKLLSKYRAIKPVVRYYGKEVPFYSKKIYNKLKKELFKLYKWEYDSINLHDDSWSPNSLYYIAHTSSGYSNGGIIYRPTSQKEAINKGKVYRYYGEYSWHS